MPRLFARNRKMNLVRRRTINLDEPGDRHRYIVLGEANLRVEFRSGKIIKSIEQIAADFCHRMDRFKSKVESLDGIAVDDSTSGALDKL